jgi:type III secretion protein J
MRDLKIGIRGRICRCLLIFTLPLLLAGCNKELYRDLSQREVNEMIATLANSGLVSNKETGENGTYKLVVDEKGFSQAIEVLDANDLPRQTYRSINDVFPGDKLILSPLEQKIRLSYAQDQQLSRSVASIDGVLDAQVHLVSPEIDVRGVTRGKASASVVIKCRSGIDTDIIAVQAKTIISNALQGLSYSDVAVVITGVTVLAKPGIMVVKSDVSSIPATWSSYINSFNFQNTQLVTVVLSFALSLFLCLLGYFFLRRSRTDGL